MNPFKTVREYENAHIVFWLFKDSCWVTGLRWLGMLMIVPTLLIAVDIAYRSRKEVSELSHNLAVCFWIAANATWMTGEFYFQDTLRPYAAVFFACGIVSLGWYYIPKIFRVRKADMVAQEVVTGLQNGDLVLDPTRSK